MYLATSWAPWTARSRLATELGMSHKALYPTRAALAKQGRIVRADDGWRLVGVFGVKHHADEPVAGVGADFGVTGSCRFYTLHFQTLTLIMSG